MRLRIAISTGLAAAVVLSVFLMLGLDSRTIGNGDGVTTGTATTAEVMPGETLMNQAAGPQQASEREVLPRSVPQVSIQEPIYVYPDGSLAPVPSDPTSLPLARENERDFGESDREYDYDDDGDERERYDDDDDHLDDRKFDWGKFVRRVTGDDDGREHDHRDDDD